MGEYVGKEEREERRRRDSGRMYHFWPCVGTRNTVKIVSFQELQLQYVHPASNFELKNKILNMDYNFT
jgi:hypothetical protein